MDGAARRGRTWPGWNVAAPTARPTEEPQMKKLLIGLVAVVVLIVAAAIVVPFFVPVDTYRDQLISRVKAATGRDLKIAGPVKLTILPALGIQASLVSFANPPGASAPDMVQLGKLELALKLFPLLSGQLEIDQFVLHDPVILLEIDKQGRPNWAFGAAQPATPAPAPAPTSSGGGARMSLTELRLDDVSVVNGTLAYFDQRTGQKQELTEVNMKLSLPDLDHPFVSDGSVTWRGKPVKTTVTVVNPRTVMNGGTSDVAIKVASEPVNFDFKGKLTNSSPVKVDGPIDLVVPSVRGLASWTGNPLQLGGNNFGRLEVKGVLALADLKIGFTDAALSLDAIKATGAFAFDGSGAKPYLQGKLDVDKLDLNPYLPPEGGAKSAAAPAGGAGHAAGWSDEPIDTAGLHAANADLDLGVHSLQLRKIEIGQSALGIQLKDGRLTADLSKLSLYQGSGHGKLTLDGSGTVPGLDANFNLAGVQIEPLLRDAAGFDRVSGSGAFDIAVTGHGRSERELVGALNGKGDLNLANGVVKGLNLGDMLRNVTSAFGGGSGGGGQTDFAKLTGTYTITNGILKNTDLDLQSSLLHVTGTGTADLPRRTVDYRVTPLNAQVGSVSLAGISVAIEGSWDNLSYRPDLSSGVVKDAGKLLQGAVPGAAGVAGKAGAIPGNVLNNLFGSKK
jgi:AsmA protein